MKIWLLILKSLVPEFLVTLILLVTKETSNPALAGLFFLGTSVLIRVIWNSAMIIHGLGHAALITILDQDPEFFKATNILENRSLSSVYKSCIPFTPISLPFIPDATLLWVAVGRAEGIRFKALGGILFNLIALVLALLVISLAGNPDTWFHPFLLQTFVGANVLLILSSFSDWVAVVTDKATCFHCGNFGFLGKRLPEDGNALLPTRVIEICKTMGQETEIRGEQAGGGAVFARNRANQVVFIGKKIVNQKRHNLTESLETAFAAERRNARFGGARALETAVVSIWHYRYATSSPPAILETHWHEWIPARTAKVWRVENGQWICERKIVNHRITHNGDFDAWELFGESISNANLGLWLERVLQTPNSTLGDSPKIAGIMDLLLTQGMWDASLRLAFQLAVAESITDAFDGRSPAKTAPNTAPTQQEISTWAEMAEVVFLRHKNTLLSAGATDLVEVCPQQLNQFAQLLLQHLSQDVSIRQWPSTKQAAFAKTAVHVFFYNNLYQATKLFLSRAKGSFGLVAASTLAENSLILSAWGQPMATGFNVQDNYMVYASEPAAVDAVLCQSPRSYRLDLDQKAGEIAWIGIHQITVYSLQEDRELLGSELEQRWVPLQGNPYILPPPTSAEDPVAQDLQEIPGVLNAIDAAWRDPVSFNRQSADYLAELLIAKAKAWECRRNSAIEADEIGDAPSLDLLITGVESSLWLGEQFAQDLTTLFPTLRVQALSANQVLRKLQSGWQELHLGRTSIVLAISQSGQTFPTLQATHAFEELRCRGRIAELFILTGELCSLMGTAIGQFYYQNSSFTRRIFINGSGRRTAEPTTIAIAAAQSTLTELLLYLGKRLRAEFPSHPGPLGMTLTTANLLPLEQLQADFIGKRVVSIVGATTEGKPLDSLTRQKLVASGQQWALHITETPLVWAIHALYVLISVGLQASLVQTIFRLLVAVASLPTPILLLLPLITLADILFYIFGPWLWTVGLRYLQGRPLLARMGKRTLVIGDVPWVHQLLNVYVSKLFALSYGIASLDVHGANPQDHLLHDFGHRVVRGTLVFLGVPDGRRSSLQKEDESAVLMTGKQTSGIRNFNTGAEIVAVSQSPTIAHQGFQDTIILPSSPADLLTSADATAPQQRILEELRESRFGSFQRLLASYVFFWALAKKVASFPVLRYPHWKSQSRTRIMTTAAPVARVTLHESVWKIDR